MSFIARLRRGTHIINLNASPFTISADFTPPNMVEIPQIAENRNRKARRTGEQHTSQTLAIPVHVEGSSVGHIRNNVDIINTFLKDAGRADKPTYFDWRPDNYIGAEPVWGQFGSYRSLEILWGELEYGDQYGWWDHSKIVPDCSLNVLVGPVIEGTRQYAVSAKGGICEDWIGILDGRSRGLMIPEPDATNGNKFTNPVFGNSTWSSGWTGSAGLNTQKITLPEYILHSLQSVRLTATGASGTFYQSINVGNTNAHKISCYVKLQDGSAPAASVIKMYYGTDLTTTYTSVGNGWYRLTASCTGVASATDAGVIVYSGKTIFATAFQLEERAYATPFFYGDMLGCHWAGTAHASASHREIASVSIPAAFLTQNNLAEGTICVVWKADKASTEFTGDGYLIYDSTGRFKIYWDESAEIWHWNINTGVDEEAVSSSATSFAAGDVIVFHFVWTATDKLKIYINGALAGTSAAYNTPGTDLATTYIGSDSTPANWIGGTFLGISPFRIGLTLAQVQAHYNDLAPAIAADKLVASIPYIWTKDGDNIVDYIDSGAYRNIAIIGGVPGSIQAKTEIKATVAGMNNADIYIGNLDIEYRKYLDPEFLSYVPASPPDTISLDTAETTLATISLDDDEFEIVSGKRIAVMLRVDDDTSGNNVLVKLGVNPGGAYYYSKLAATIWATSSTDTSIDLTPEQGIIQNDDFYRELGITRALAIRAAGKRISGSALDFKLHSAQIMPFPMLRLINTFASGIAPTILYIDGKAREVNSAALSYTYSVEGSKRDFGLLPGRYNLLVSYIGKEGVATDSGDTLTYNAIYVTPRWAIL